MTKDQLQQELNEKVKEGIKPSDLKRLKRSKSLSDIPTAPLNNAELTRLQAENEELKKQIQELERSEVFVDALEDSPAELKTTISQLEDQILELRLSKLKDFSDYLEKKQELKKDLESNVDYGTKEIERLETKLRTIHKKKLELQDQLSQVQSKNARLELKLIDEQNKDSPLAPTLDFWTEYGPLILMLSLYLLSVWLVNKNRPTSERNYQ